MASPPPGVAKRAIAMSSVQDRIGELAVKCRFDPLSWACIAWDWGVDHLSESSGPREWQAEILSIIRDHLQNESTRYEPLQISVASGHGIGKSCLMGLVSNWAESCFVDAKIVCTANTETQLRTKTVPEVGMWFRNSITASWFDVQATSIKSTSPNHVDSWRMDFVPWSQNNTEAFAGLHNQGRIIVLLFDEASKIHDKVWEVAEGAMTDENTIIIWLAFGNPTQNSGRFRECFRKFRHRWRTFHIDSRTVPGTNKNKINQWVEDYGEDSDFVKVRVRGQFPSQSARQFISSVDADAARGRELKPEQYNFAPKIIALDPAWTGEDELVIGMRQGLYYQTLRTMPFNDNDIQVANILAQLEDQHKADAVIIDGGFGTGVVSAGRTMGRHWHLVWFAGKSPDPGCLNMRAYMWREMRDWCKDGGSFSSEDDVLYDDLIAPETVARIDGKIQIESKEDMKIRGLPSPNRGDALAMTFAIPVVSTSRVPLGKNIVNCDNYVPF